ncbi:MAG: ATP-binding protein [Cyanobacteria bacterium P01_A01_bin.114]
MARSLRIAFDHLAQVNLSLKRRGYPSQKTFAADVGPSLSTVKKFLKGDPIDYENFRELCDRLDIDWQTVVHIEVDHPPALITQASELAPFNVGIPVPHPACFFGRTREISRCFSLLKRHPLQNIAIIGQRRSGKTSLLKHLASLTTVPSDQLRPDQKSDWLPHPEHYRWIFIDFQDARFATREGILHYLLKALGIAIAAPCDLACFMELVSDHLKYPTIILLDEIGVGLQRCPELDDTFWESLRSLATNQTGGRLAFILASHEAPMQLASHTGHSSPFFNIFGYTTTLGVLSEKDARALISSSPISFSANETDWILTHSGGWPFLLQILCSNRLMALENHDCDNIWQTESIRQIAAFQYLLE